MSKSDESKTRKAAPLTVGCDDGFSNTNVVILSGGKPQQLVLPSRARAGVHTTSQITGSSDEIVPVYETEGLRYTVGDMPDSEGAGFQGYPFSAMNRSVVQHALRMAGLGGREVRLATGLPLMLYYKGDKPNTEIIERKKQSLLQAISAVDGSPTASIVSHEVYPEGLSAWVDYAVDDQGNLRNDEDETVGVVDMGGRTIDIAVVMPGQRIDHGSVGSKVLGAHDVVEEVRVALVKKYGFEIEASRIERALSTKTIKMWGKVYDISEEVNNALLTVGQQIESEIDRRLGNGNRLDKILFVGGGTYLFKDVAAKYPNAVVHEQPEVANAPGFAKFLDLN